MDKTKNFARDNHFYSLEKEREEARASQDALKYFNLTNELEAEDRDDFLYEQGEAENIYLRSQRGKKPGQDQDIADFFAKETTKLEEMAKKALTRFPELQRGEMIRDVEITRRLREIRETGYDVPSYSGLKKDEKWRLLTRIRGELWSRLQTANPELAREIQIQNQKKKDGPYWIR